MMHLPPFRRRTFYKKLINDFPEKTKIHVPEMDKQRHLYKLGAHSEDLQDILPEIIGYVLIKTNKALKKNQIRVAAVIMKGSKVKTIQFGYTSALKNYKPAQSKRYRDYQHPQLEVIKKWADRINQKYRDKLKQREDHSLKQAQHRKDPNNSTDTHRRCFVCKKLLPLEKFKANVLGARRWSCMGCPTPKYSK